MTTLETQPNGAAVPTEVPARPLPVDEPPASNTGPDDGSAEATSGSAGPRRGGLRDRWRERKQRRAVAPAAHPDEAMRMLQLVRRSRGWAVTLDVLIMLVSFVLSFTAIQELAGGSAWAGWKSWLWPLILDGPIVLATLGIVTLAPYRSQFWNRVFMWVVLAVAALVSIVCNAVHAWLVTEHMPMWMRYGVAGLACVPPVALLVTTHILAILWRFSPTPPPDEVSQAQQQAGEIASAIAEQRADKWVASAVKMHEMGLCTKHSTSTLAAVLGYLYDRRPAMSLRAIGGQADVKSHHSEVSAICEGAKAALGVAPPGRDR